MIVIKKFKGELPVSFDPFLQEKECMVNATEMANIFGKQVRDFLKSEKTQEYLRVLEIELGNSNFISENDQKIEFQKDARLFETEISDKENNEILESQSGNSLIEIDFQISENILKVVKGGRNSGTWMHRFLAIDFAMWLDPYFKYWVATTIDEIVFGHARKRDLSFKRTLEIKKEMKELREKLDPTGADFVRYIELDEELKQEKTQRTQITTERVKEINFFIFSESEMLGRK